MKYKEKAPPSWADRLLEWYCSPDLLEDLQGDFYERYYRRSLRHGHRRASVLYVWDVFSFIRPYTIKRKGTHSDSVLFLLPNYIKTAYRNLKRQRLTTVVNILGLSLGLYSFVLICLFVNDEAKYDKYLPNADRIFRITFSYTSPASAEHSAWVQPEAGEALKETYPEVEAHTALVNEKVTVRNSKFSFREESFYYASTSFFDVFPYEFKMGSKSAFLPGSIVLTGQAAQKYFQDTDPLGKSLEIENKLYQVTGILKDIPDHTDLKFDALMASKDLKPISWWTFNYILFKKEIDPKQFRSKLDHIYQKVSAEEFEELGIDGRFHIEALPDVHFGEKKRYDTPKSSKANLYIFSTVALLILLTAVINYINISLASAAKRQGEVGVRKSIGAQNVQLRAQFLLESMITCISSLIIAVIGAIYSLPYLNLLTEKNIHWREITSPWMIIFLITVSLIVSIVSGSYPAFHLSSVKPADILKGKVLLPGKTFLRKVLVVVQFTISIILIISTLLIFRQLKLIQSITHGYTKDQTVIIDIPRERSLTPALKAFKNKVTAYPFVRKASMVGFNSWPTADRSVEVYEVHSNGQWQLKPLNEIYVDEDYFGVLGLTVKEGRSFKTNEVEKAGAVVMVNQALVKNLGWENPLREIVTDEDGYEYRVIGVLQDFHFNSVRQKVEPMILFPGVSYPEKLMVSLDTDRLARSIELLEGSWQKGLPGQPFVFEFLDHYFQQQYHHEQSLKQVFSFFMIIAISIACLGLFGLIALVMNQKLKEVSIRKVFGAGRRQLLAELSKDYVMLIALSLGIASPLAAWIMNRWLNGFIYKADISWDIFLLASGLVLALAILTMSYHIIKASFTNPSHILKHE